MTADNNSDMDCMETFSKSIDEALRAVQNLQLSQLATAFYQASALQWVLAVRLNRSQWSNGAAAVASTSFTDPALSAMPGQLSACSLFQLGLYDFQSLNPTATLPTPGALPTALDDAQAGPIDLTNANKLAAPPRKRQRRNSAAAATTTSSGDPSRVRFHVVLLDASSAAEKPSAAKVRQLTAAGLGRPHSARDPVELSVFTSASDLRTRLVALYPEVALADVDFDTCYADKDGQLAVLSLDSFRYLATAIGDEGCLYLRPKTDISTNSHCNGALNSTTTNNNNNKNDNDKNNSGRNICENSNGAEDFSGSLGFQSKDGRVKKAGLKNLDAGDHTASSLLDPTVRDQIVLQTRWRGSCTRRTHICECDVCGVKFTRKDSLTRHSRKHSGKSFVCQACGKCFAENYYFKRHKCRSFPATGTTAAGDSPVRSSMFNFDDTESSLSREKP